MLYDFHTHSLLSDGALSPLELVRRALICGYRAIAITDHVGVGYLERVIAEITADCALATSHWDIIAIPGVELTHLPPAAIAETAHRAKELGARLVMVHGETVAEPVAPGTNRAAVECPDVDILAHPGLLTAEEATMAAANGIFLEVTSRTQHAVTNGHVVAVARRAGAKLLLNSDAHDEGDLLTPALARNVALGAALSNEEIEYLLQTNPKDLMPRLLPE